MKIEEISKKKIQVTITVNVEANIKADSEEEAGQKLIGFLEGMSITENDDEWDATLSEVMLKK